MTAMQNSVGHTSYDFTGKTAVIFGGTTAIGRSTARDFALAGGVCIGIR